MKRLIISFKNYYSRVIRSIAFYPIIISAGFMLLAFAMLYIEPLEMAIRAKEKLSFLLIKDIETARTMLSTLIGGIFSLTVFSFSMVMVVLSQSSSNFSPRLLPGLISNKKNQIILGMYIGTLLYSLVVLMNVRSYDAVENSVGLSVLLGVFFGVSCTGMFVYFIHTISQDIQIQNIIERIFNETLVSLNHHINPKEKPENLTSISAQDEVYFLTTDTTGYYKGFSEELMCDFINEITITIEIIPVKNSYVYHNEPILKYNKKLSQKQIDTLYNLIYIETNMHNTDDYFSNMVKLMEVAVRAMSPGVNDPGTAISVIHKLGSLLHKVFQINERNYLPVNSSLVVYHDVDYYHIMRVVFQPIRQYAKQDFTVMQTLINTLTFVHKTLDIQPASKNAIKIELNALLDDAKQSIQNRTDLKTIEDLS